MRAAAFPSSRFALVAAAAFFSAGFVGLAHANDVHWSVGVASPGVSIGVSNSRPVIVVPAPVYVQPAPIYRRAAPIFVQPQVVYVQPGSYGRGWHKEHKEHKYGRDDDKKRGDNHGRHGQDRGERHGYYQPYGYQSPYAGYAPVQVQPQVQYSHSPQVYGGVHVQSGYAPGWR